MTYIDRDPETLAAQERKAKKEKMDKDDEERLMDFIDKQIERAKQDTKEEEGETSKTPLMRPENDAPLILDIKLKPKPKLLPVLEIKQKKIKNEDSQVKSDSSKSISVKEEKLKRSIDDDETKYIKKLKINNDNAWLARGWLREGLMVEIVKKDDKNYKARGIVQSMIDDVGEIKLKTPEEVNGLIVRLDEDFLEPLIDEKNDNATKTWLREDLIVKIITTSIGDKYYKATGVVQSVNGFIAKVQMKTPEEVKGHTARIDENFLEPVLPAIDKNNDDKIESWLRKGLMVKVIAKGKYYKAKGVVQSITPGDFVGVIKLKTPEEVNGHIVRIDESLLETVIPAIGKEVIILWGDHKGMRAIVKKLHIEHYSIDVELVEKKKIVKKLPYEQVCKYIG